MPSPETSPDPLFALTKEYPFFRSTPRRRRWAQKLDRLLGLEGMSAMVSQIPSGHRNPYQSSYEHLAVKVEGRQEFKDGIPKKGATIVVANHPLGALDALIASGLTIEARPDTLVFGNAVLQHPSHSEWFLPLEILDESSTAARLNLASMRKALAHLKAGGCVVIFPAGEVERWRWSKFMVEEGTWTPHLARLAQKSGASILPLGFPCENPLWFHLPGVLHPTLRLMALPRALLSLRGQTLSVRTGKPLLPSELPRDPTEWTQAVREVVLRLAYREINASKK